MSKIKEFLDSLLIRVAPAAGARINILAFFPKRFLPEPRAKIPMAILIHAV